MPKRIDIDNKLLTKLYLEDKLSAKKISKIVGCSSTCVVYNLHRQNIKARDGIVDLKGQKFGNLLVIKMCKERRRRRICWECLCDCGNKSVHQSDVLTGGHAKKCRFCRRKDYVGEISGRCFARIRNGAKARKLEFTITKEFLWNLFLKQERKCALSGLKITLPFEFRDIFTASLDRIDSTKGYTEDNVQWVHKNINKIKWDLPEKIFIKLCKRIYLKNKDKIKGEKLTKEELKQYNFAQRNKCWIKKEKISAWRKTNHPNNIIYENIYKE